MFEGTSAERFEFCTLPREMDEDPNAWALNERLAGGGRQGGPTEMPTVEVVTQERRRRYARADGMSVGSPVFIRLEAADTLRRDLGIVFLDAPTTDGSSLQLLRVPVIPALDTAASKIRWLKPGCALVVDRAVFRPEVIRDHAAFAVPETNRTYLSDRFVDAWTGHKFQGLDFKLLWETP